MILSGAALSAPERLAAQSSSAALKLTDNYDFIKFSNPWLSARNPAGLVHIDTVRISTASISAESVSGSFRDYNDASKVFSLGARAESFYQLGKSLVFFGEVEYQNSSLKGSEGSAFMSTDRLPFDLVEAEPNPGKAQQNRYHLTGAIAGEISSVLALGAKLDYTAADFSKHKDLRHQNYLMDLRINGGAHLHLGDKFEAGLDLIYRRSTESVRFDLYGTADKTYWTLISYAAFMGRKEAFGEAGYTEKGRQIPLFNEFKGAGAQFVWMPSEGLKFFGDVSYLKRDGYYGEKSTTTAQFDTFKGNVLEVNLRADYSRGGNLHTLEAAYSTEALDNYSTNFREVENQENTARYYEYYSPIKRARKVWNSLSGTYTLQMDFTGQTPAWIIKAGFGYERCVQTGYEYPFYRKQRLTIQQFKASAVRNLIGKSIIWGLRAGVAYSKGSGAAFDDGVLAQPSAGQEDPASMEQYLLQNHEFLTSPQWSAVLGIRATFLAKALGLRPYVDLQYSLRRASDLTWIQGNARNCINLTIGTAF